MSFRAVVVDKVGKDVEASVKELDDSQLPAHDVEVDVEYSTINYKDGLVLQGLGNLVKTYPHVPGVDFAGTVRNSASGEFAKGDRVVLTGWRVGELHWGGLSQRANTKAEWLLPVPEAMSTRDAMAAGTAGLTAMLAINEMEAHGLSTANGPILVTGASGGVGTFATCALASLGYEVHAVSGKAEMTGYLKDLGAASVLGREEFAEASSRPLEGERWAGVVDSVGGVMLSRLLAQMKYGGIVAAIGLAGGAQLQTTVIPFLLRGVELLGIDSVMCPRGKREAAWKRLASLGVVRQVESGVKVVGLKEAIEAGTDITKGRISGRVVVDVRR